MKKETAERLASASDSIGDASHMVLIRDDYQGGGLSRKATTGVSVRRLTTLILVAAHAASMLADEGGDVDGFVADLRGLSSDAAGLGYVVY